MAFPASLTNAVDNTTDVIAAHLNALEVKMGIDASAVTSTHDYKLSGVTGSDKASSLAGEETLTNKTLTSTTNIFPSGAVIQTVYANNTTTTAFTTTDYVDSGLTATITPSSTSNKILIIANIGGVHKDTTSGGGLTLALVRTTTVVIVFSFAQGYQEVGVMYFGANGCSYLDSPSSTSAITYKVQGKLFNASGTTDINNGSYSSITLMEIAG